MNGVCHCGRPAVKRTSWSDANSGRSYLSCVNSRTLVVCNYFCWVDQPGCARCTKIIPGLLRNMNSKDAEIDELKKDIAANMNSKDAEIDELKKDIAAVKRSNKKLIVVILVCFALMYQFKM